MRRFLRRLGDGGNQAVFNNLLSLPWSVLLDSRQITPVANGNPVILWPDSSGNGRDANSAGVSPTYAAAASPKGIALCDFGTGSSNGKQLNGALPVGGVGNANGFSFYSWFQMVATPSASGFDSQIVFGSDIVNGFRFFSSLVVGAGDVEPEFVATGTTRGGQATIGTHVQSVICQPPNNGTGVASLYVDGALIATGTWQCNPNTAYLVSGNAGGNVGLQGKIGLAGFGPRADGDATRKNIEAYLRRIWG